MKNQTSSKKSIISIVVIIAAVAIGYFFYTGNKAPAGDSLLQTQATPEANAVSSRILNLLNQIRSLKIDTSIFDNVAYQTLQDYSIQIPEVPVGRQNPFAPLPGAPVTP
jgi:flagellar basal body-associated protein FliL